MGLIEPPEMCCILQRNVAVIVWQFQLWMNHPLLSINAVYFNFILDFPFFLEQKLRSTR